VSGVAKAEEKAKKKPDPAKMFEKKDADGDGFLTLDELKKGMKGKQLEGAEKRFKRLDADGDGKVSLEELKAGFAAGGQKKKKD
jgi:Ca2+-binding EF-hand superfamily protein